jgi:BirA family biotin operon repressor/biotin-[acetyl-CoA-carboxylase] ligase
MSIEHTHPDTPGNGGLAGRRLGWPHIHARRLSSTNDRARSLALAGAPHGTLVTAVEQTAGRGRQGRRWEAPPGSALLMSLVLRLGGHSSEAVVGAGRGPARTPAPRASPPHVPLPLLAAVAVCDAIGPQARVKWPNDVLLPREDQRTIAQTAGMPKVAVKAKVAGILTEGRPQEGWAVLGIGVNVAVRLQDLPPDVRQTAATLGGPPTAVAEVLAELLAALERRLAEHPRTTLDAWRRLDVLRGQQIEWLDQGHSRRGHADGIDAEGRLLVVLPSGERRALDAGEVHLR